MKMIKTYTTMEDFFHQARTTLSYWKEQLFWSVHLGGYLQQFCTLTLVNFENKYLKPKLTKVPPAMHIHNYVIKRIWNI